MRLGCEFGDGFPECLPWAMADVFYEDDVEMTGQSDVDVTSPSSTGST